MKKRFVVHVDEEGLVVRVSDQLGGDEDDELEVDARDLAQVMEEEMRPMSGGLGRAISFAESGEEARVLVLLGDEQLERPRIRGIAGGCRRCVRSRRRNVPPPLLFSFQENSKR